MGTHGKLFPLSGLKANADLSSYQHRFIKYTGGKVTYCNTQGERAYGVLTDNPAAADRAAAVVAMVGQAKVEAGAAVAQGAPVMTDTAGRAITWTSTNHVLGVAMEAASGAGEKIMVQLQPEQRDLSNTVKGVIPLPLGSAREIATNAIQNLAASGGLLCSDSTPIYERVNGATDKALRLNWASSDSNEITFDSVPKPHDLDASADMTIHLMSYMSGSTDTPVIAVGYFEGVGDTNAGGNTAALSDTEAEQTVTIAAANIAAAPGYFTVTLTPAAHTSDALYLMQAWCEYTRIVN